MYVCMYPGMYIAYETQSVMSVLGEKSIYGANVRDHVDVTPLENICTLCDLALPFDGPERGCLIAFGYVNKCIVQ